MIFFINASYLLKVLKKIFILTEILQFCIKLSLHEDATS
jgi:hypothetical protein